MLFKIVNSWGDYPADARDTVFLSWDDWNDYSFYTLFGIFYVDTKGDKLELGNIKIGHFGQKERERRLKLNDEFEKIGDEFFSVGTDVEYYEKLNRLGVDLRNDILASLNDIAIDDQLYARAITEDVTKFSFLRNLSETTIQNQFKRVAFGGVKLTNYIFRYFQNQDGDQKPLVLDYSVIPDSVPPTNIHILIGRNGIGKTYMIGNMIESLTKSEEKGKFVFLNLEDHASFANLVCVNFSAFDRFKHPKRNIDNTKEFPYSYIGIKSIEDDESYDKPKSPDLLAKDFVDSIINCINSARTAIWKESIEFLESDPTFKAYDISNLIKLYQDSRCEKEILGDTFHSLSSGHKIILLTITRLVETVQERSLVLYDEPESHLHPPLLSSFIRAISNLLIDRNGVAIIATHSPVILQEVPKSCVWKLRRDGVETVAERLEIESFGENVGILTQEIFQLEVTDSGFHKILSDLVDDNDNYEAAVRSLNHQIGLEGKAILRSMFYQKNNAL